LTWSSRRQRVAIAFVVTAMLRLGGLALNNVVVLNEAATPLLYALPLSAMLAALMLMEQARRKLSASRFPGLIVDPIVQTLVWLFTIIPRWRAASAGGRR
jgi:lipopolysaccharide export system permease protein